MKTSRVYAEDELRIIGSKRGWVPMWLWMNLIFRCGVYEWPVVGRIFYVPAAGANA